MTQALLSFAHHKSPRKASESTGSSLCPSVCHIVNVNIVFENVTHYTNYMYPITSISPMGPPLCPLKPTTSSLVILDTYICYLYVYEYHLLSPFTVLICIHVRDDCLGSDSFSGVSSLEKRTSSLSSHLIVSNSSSRVRLWESSPHPYWTVNGVAIVPALFV